MRLKNVPYAKEKITNSKYVIENASQYKGNYQSFFNNSHPIKIEIGMGKGDFIIGNALKYPDINFIGIEKYDSVLVRAIEKVEQLEINNLYFIRMDATEIEDVFFKEIDTIYLNFSDPWPKNKHAFRRLSSELFLERYTSVFKDKNHIIQKTDNIVLFASSIKSYNNYGYKINDITMDLYSTDLIDNNIQTEYEMKFVEKGIKINYIDVIK